MRKLKQRLFSLLLCAAMLFSLCAPAAAEDTGKYLTWDETQEKLVEANIPSSITEIKIGITTLNSTKTAFVKDIFAEKAAAWDTKTLCRRFCLLYPIFVLIPFFPLFRLFS